ncbi:MAG: 16S rRNA (cytosine(1402)-N(4))-methyltransferase RsmH [Gammaproteobacteria bacterium]|jgi:16S rRNA (cytosine1402-N4)-methyltransferase|nr:16S rRNA (cytosine(1402)-N(4))-methyltransferase RsmH [Gammaproteobacteria bacterium]MBT6754711.1 16S rRNA (cytosine(1402)-N(4))-methyltransferase RsmH [Gammaproteobacteria bacterium]MBT7523091.1 16S rRNA (cytosine(1402)-N(4))-methyltransferase RsmH [Gammaproteobacteria bacterium]MBT7814836.1 16S rRNA (cytosine(1402)-N(4))-methyltransferase RsmH [Gammaproteobacteria bacterium]
MSFSHNPVMLETSINNLNIIKDGTYVDCTFGRGGHSKNILERIGKNGKLIAIDKDNEAEDFAKENFNDDSRFIFEKNNFSNIVNIVEKHNGKNKVNGILLDLGVSSPQLDNPERGFSFMKEGPLDMRMDTSSKMTALLWLKEADLKDISRVLKIYGEEKYSYRIARAIKKSIEKDSLQTTIDLSKVISECYPKSISSKINPATRSFQAIRIYINKELQELEKILDDCLQIIEIGGRLVVISFHSLEDRIVKNFINKHSLGKEVISKLPITNLSQNLNLKKIKVPLKASDNEIDENIRSRSAKIRVAEKI